MTMETWKLFGSVNRKLLPVKVHYFLFLAALACVLPFRTIFAKQLGISATAIGAIFFAVPIFRIISNPLCGFILDYFKRFRLTISLMMIIVCLSHVAMVFIPPRTTVLAANNNSHIAGTQFHSKLEYSCRNNILLNVSEHSIAILNFYNELNATDREGSFTCFIKCSDSSNDSLPQNTMILNQCGESLRFEYVADINILECNMEVQLKSGKILNVHDYSSKSLISNINASSVVYSKLSGTFNDKKCSKEPGIVLNGNPKDEIENKSDTPREFSDNFKSPNSHSATSTNENRKISTLYKYKMKSETVEGFTLCPCDLKIGCNTKCFSKNVMEEYNVAENEVLLKPITEDKEILSIQFWSLFILIIISSQSFSAIMFMMDTVCYELLQDKKGNYGQQRLWGTIGWGIGSLVGGYVNQIVSPDSGEINYAPSFFLLAVIALIDLIPVYQLKITDLKYSSHIWKDVCFLLSKPNILYNIVVVYFVGILSGFIWNYQFWFMEELGSNQVLLGLSQTFECIFELPWFVVSGWVISKIGHDNCNSFTFFCFGVRYLCFALMYDPWMTLPVALIHGPTFGLFYASMTMYAKNEAPPGTEATVQSLLHLCFEGIGVATGIVIGGASFDHFGSRTTFVYATGISFVLFFLNVVISILFYRSKKKLKEVKDAA